VKRTLIVLVCIAVLACGCVHRTGGSGFVLLASTVGPVDAGIIQVLEERFEQETGIRVRHVSAGTGAALDIARKGSVDLVLVHAKTLEEKFIADGFGTEQIPLMYNDFVIVGPSDDPAGIKGTISAVEAFDMLACKGDFVSRGDKSGTHMAELELWKKAGVTPSGAWYKVYEKGSDGNAATLRYADDNHAYTLIDRASYRALKDSIKLIILVEGDEALVNYMNLIPVNPQKFSGVNYKGALCFAHWLTDPEKGQMIIRDFGKDRSGESLFFPNSKKWQKINNK
jgi:tungstate transport system substrate-binding protein